MIELGKHYRTRDGKYRTDNDTLRVLMVDRAETLPVLFVMKTPDGWTSVYARADGRWWKEEHDLDLIEIKPRRKGEVWVNCYPDGSFSVRKTRESSDSAALTSRIACVRVEFEYEEGEGL